MCQSVPGLDEPAAFVDMKLVPFISQTAGVPSLPCHRMSDLPIRRSLIRSDSTFAPAT